MHYIKKKSIMLLDNKTLLDPNTPFKVFDFLKQYTENGKLDIVTGFFSVNALALFYEEMNQIEKFRLILGKLTKSEEDLNKNYEIEFRLSGNDQFFLNRFFLN